MALTEGQLWENAFVINLAERKDRLDVFLQEFGHRVKNLHRIEAIKGEAGYAALRQACTLSHLAALDKAFELRYEYFILFEDDACINPKYLESISNALEELPDDFDMFYLGAWTTEFKPYSARLRRSEWSMLAHAILFSRRSLELIRNHVRENTYLGARPVDYLYGDLHLRLNAYTCIPSFIIQRPTFSSIENRFVDLSEKVNWQNNSTVSKDEI